VRSGWSASTSTMASTSKFDSVLCHRAISYMC
jgi:hypothetical protein